ncbi:MAG TPA: rhomboid family intramembrane serine protease [Actinomycetes bacterium]|nr:rhomboid family intramembrane serine protease [Actinomycetes bacterium]
MTDDPGTASPPAAVPTCYRHPGRETYIRCARCNRPICPDCMVPASVGFQCPECVREGNSTQRAPRTAFGGRLASGARVTMVLIGLNVLMYVAELALGRAFVNDLALVGLAREGFLGPIVGVADGEWWRLVTATFLHDPGSFLHILFNMYALYVLGPPLEAMLGHARFLALYLLSALGGTAASYTFSAPNSSSVGASGAIFGLFAAWIVLARKQRLDARPMLVLLGINLVLGFVIAGIDWRGHLGGMVTGAAVAAIMAYAPRGPRRTTWQVAGAVAVLALVVLVDVWRTASLLS